MEQPTTKRCIVSTCGTSILTNQGHEIRKLIIDYAHVKDKTDIGENDRKELENLIKTIKNSLQEEGSIENLKKMSAEINGITLLYDNHFPNSGDTHYLIATDTWLGTEAASLLKDWLRGREVNDVQLVAIDDLGASSLAEFQLGIAGLIGWCSQTLPGWRENQYTITFQLNGGFKSIQGLMQTLAQFYSDETVYIFESGNELLHIPRLPVKLDLEEVVLKH